METSLLKRLVNYCGEDRGIPAHSLGISVGKIRGSQYLVLELARRDLDYLSNFDSTGGGD